MEAFQQSALTILEVYLSRGIKAIELLKLGEVEKAIDLCSWRNAAFHDFKALDQSLMQKGIDIADLSDVQAVWLKISEVNSELEDALRLEIQHTNSNLTSTRAALSKIMKFHSGKVSQHYHTRV